MEKHRYDLTSADTKIIGFDFQYFYFINELLKISSGETVGFEAKDDVHTEISTDIKTCITLMQLKHTVQKNSKGNPINLTDKDEDLWKSLSNWCKVICDKSQGRETIKAQLNYLKDTNFILATNKNICKNKFISNIKKYMNDKLSLDDLTKYLKELEKKTTNDDIKKYINSILAMNPKVIELFFKKLDFIDSGDNIIENIKLNISRKMIATDRVNDVFNSLFSELKQDFFKKVKKFKHQTITFDEWIKKYTCIFEKNRDTYLPIREFKPALPNDLLKQTFVEEMIEINDIYDCDLPQVAEFTEFMLNVQMNLNEWINDGVITKSDLEKFHRNAISLWKNIHRKSHRTTETNFNLDNSNAIKCLDNIREKELKLLTTDFDIEFSNGEFYYLANEVKIGWKNKWKDKY